MREDDWRAMWPDGDIETRIRAGGHVIVTVKWNGKRVEAQGYCPTRTKQEALRLARAQETAWKTSKFRTETETE